MRKWIPTLLLVLILGAGIIYAKSQNFFREPAPSASQKLVQIAEKDITSIDIIAADGQQVELSRKNNVWRMTKPADYPLNGYAVNNWLTSINGVTLGADVDASPKDIAKYGISSSKDKISIAMKDGSKKVVNFGATLPSGEAVYVQKDGGAVASVPIESQSQLLLAAADFAETTPFHWENASVKQLEWDGRTYSWVMKRSETEKTAWTLNGKNIKADKADALSSQVKNLASDQQLRKASELQGAVHRFTLSVTLNSSEQAQVYQAWTLSDDSQTVWVVPPGSNWAYALSLTDIEAVEKAGGSDAP